MNILQTVSENSNIIQVICSLCMLLVTVLYVAFTKSRIFFLKKREHVLKILV